LFGLQLIFQVLLVLDFFLNGLFVSFRLWLPFAILARTVFFFRSQFHQYTHLLFDQKNRFLIFYLLPSFFIFFLSSKYFNRILFAFSISFLGIFSVFLIIPCVATTKVCFSPSLSQN